MYKDISSIIKMIDIAATQKDYKEMELLINSMDLTDQLVYI